MSKIYAQVVAQALQNSQISCLGAIRQPFTAGFLVLAAWSAEGLCIQKAKSDRLLAQDGIAVKPATGDAQGSAAAAVIDGTPFACLPDDDDAAIAIERTRRIWHSLSGSTQSGP